MVSLTVRQQDALRFIVGYLDANGVPPAMKEIAEGIGCRSLNAAFQLVEGLEKRGAVSRSGSAWRGINVLATIAIPRSPDGAPLRFIRVGGQD